MDPTRELPNDNERSLQAGLPWNDHELQQLPFAVEGLRLGMTQEQARAVIPEVPARRTDNFWTWGPHQMKTALFQDGRIRELRGVQLERCGEVVVRQGDPVEALTALNLPSQTLKSQTGLEYQQVLKMPPFEIVGTIMHENAALSLEHKVILGTDDVVGKVFQLSLRFETTTSHPHI